MVQHCLVHGAIMRGYAWRLTHISH
ncbi:hypothetical protein LINPERHAP1_LOCUS32632 [Linum perenne]